MKSFPLPQLTQIEWTPIETAVPGLPPVQVHFDIPSNQSSPDELQLQLLAQVAKNFPTLWSTMLQGIREQLGQSEYGEAFPVFKNPETAIADASGVAAAVTCGAARCTARVRQLWFIQGAVHHYQ